MMEKEIRIKIDGNGANIYTSDKISQVEHKKPDLGDLNFKEIYDIIMKKRRDIVDA